MRFRPCLIGAVLLLANAAIAQTLDPGSYTLTAAAAEKFVKATQQMAQSGGSGPDIQGNAMDLARLKASLDGNPAAQQALASAGISSTDYALFLGAAMQSMMVGQMEMAGVRGMLPPGVSRRPPQSNIDFMNANVDLFTRAMTPGASAAAASAPAPGAAGEDLPVPADAGAVLPSELLGRIPRTTSIDDGTDCTLGGLQATIDRESARAQQLEAASYGNPGDRGLARTRAEGEVLERAGDTELESCGQPILYYELQAGPMRQADEQKSEALGRIAEEESEAWAACPGIPGGKEPACEQRVAAEAAAKRDSAERLYLAAIEAPFAAMIEDMQACNAKREAVVRDAKAANVCGANVKDVLRPLVLAWQLMPYPAEHFRGICETAQGNLSTR